MMKWSFSVGVATHAEIAAALRAEGARVVDGFNKGEVERAKNNNEPAPTPITAADYLTSLDTIADAAAGVAAQLPEVEGRIFSVNVLGEILTNDAGEVIGANSTVRVDLKIA